MDSCDAELFTLPAYANGMRPSPSWKTKQRDIYPGHTSWHCLHVMSVRRYRTPQTDIVPSDLQCSVNMQKTPSVKESRGNFRSTDGICVAGRIIQQTKMIPSCREWPRCSHCAERMCRELAKRARCSSSWKYSIMPMYVDEDFQGMREACRVGCT